MKRTIRTHARFTIALIASAILILFGSIMAYRAFHIYENVVISCGQHDHLLKPLRLVALKLAICGGISAAGVFTMLLTFFSLANKSRREISALQKKNQAMDELNKKQQQLAHHQRLEIMGTMTSSIAHEFNNLLTPIMGYSMMALEKLPPEETDLYDDILEIYNSSRKAKTIISRLSDLSRKNTSTTFRQVSPDDLVKKTLDVVAPARPKNLEIKLALNCWDQRIQANEIQLSQLLLNLIINSFHAVENQDGLLKIETWFDEDTIHIRLTDNGCGIAPDVLPHIFDPFYTTKEAGKGTGLGLAIVAQVVEDHHGNIQVDSTPGVGTSFTVTLPRVAELPQIPSL